MRQVRVLIIGLLVAVALAVTLGAQSYIWSAINGIPFAPGLIVGSGATGTTTVATFNCSGTSDADNPCLSFTGSNNAVSVGIDSFNNSLRIQNSGGMAVTIAPGSVSGASTTSWYLKYPFEAVTATESAANSDTHKVYTNEGDSDGATITLPAAEATSLAGVNFFICVQTAQTLTVTAAAGDTIRLGSGVTAAAGSISSNVVGSCVTLVSINATEWFATSIVGSWSY